MKVNLPRDVLFLKDFRYSKQRDVQDAELERWLVQLVRMLEEYFRKAYLDISQGTSTFKVFTSEPTITDLQKGQIGIYSGFIYLKVGDTEMYRSSITGIGYKSLVCRLTVTS